MPVDMVASYNGKPAKFLSDMSCVAKPAMHLGTRRFVSKSRRFAMRLFEGFRTKVWQFYYWRVFGSKSGRFAIFASKSGCCLLSLFFLLFLLVVIVVVVVVVVVVVIIQIGPKAA